MSKRYGDQVRRFWANVEKTPTCWLWSGGSCGGYGVLRYDGHPSRAHRISWRLHNGTIPEGLVVRHSCDIRNCVNPAHLLLGTPADNISDMDQRGRRASRLRPEQVAEIRGAAPAKGAGRRLAQQYGVSEGTISMIRSKQTWQNIA